MHTSNLQIQRLTSLILELKTSNNAYMQNNYELPDNYVFTTNYGKLADFWAEIEANLHKLHQTNSQNLEQLEFLAEQILQQSSLLCDAIKKKIS